MKYSYLTAAAVASGLLMAAPAFAQSTSTTTAQPGKQATVQAKKQHTDGADVTGNSNFPAASGSYAKKQRTDGEDVTGNNNFMPRSK